MNATFCSLIDSLNKFWSALGATILMPATTEVGAGTLHSATVFLCIDNSSNKIAYVQPSIRPSDSRSQQSANRVYKHHQYQVILKPAPIGAQNLYIQSLRHIGIDIKSNDLLFIDDNWGNPSIGASGIGWEVWLNGSEISQLTYMNKMGGLSIKNHLIPFEITYGLERLALFLQKKSSVFELIWDESGKTYGDIQLEEEAEFSNHCIGAHSKQILEKLLSNYFELAELSLKTSMPRVAYDYCTKCSHALNLLEANSAISKSGKTKLIFQIRDLVKAICKLWIEKHAEKGG